ncbi:hypothetical protein Nmel_015003, partial [Mimus melanotis]
GSQKGNRTGSPRLPEINHRSNAFHNVTSENTGCKKLHKESSEVACSFSWISQAMEQHILPHPYKVKNG